MHMATDRTASGLPAVTRRSGNCRLGVSARGRFRCAPSVAWPGSGWLVTVAQVSVDPDSPEFPYRQAAAWLRRRIETGELGPRLPSYMHLAEEFGVAPMTMQRALKVLKDEGLIQGQAGRGTFIRQ